MVSDKTIESVVTDGLCTGCGTCACLCKRDAIEMAIDQRKGIYLARFNIEKCNSCGICFQVCPGREVDFKVLNLAIFGKAPQDFLIGNYLNCYVGHSTDYHIRYNGASGGVVTQVLLFALEEGIIDGALVTKMKEDKPLEPEPFIARTREEIIEASRSKYCPVPANMALRAIIDSKSGESFAVVGLPCHLHGIRKARQVDKDLERRIVLHLGLFCGHTPNFWATESLLRRMKVKKEKVIRLDYRGEGWLGAMTICLTGGQTQTILYRDYHRFTSLDFFTPTRCLMCCDPTAELADISFGDAWLPELRGDKVGRSMIISRTRFGEEILERARVKGCVELYQITLNEAKRSQFGRLYFRKKVLKARFGLFRRKPLFNTSLLKPSLVDYPLSLFPYVNHRVSQNPVLRLLLGKLSVKLIRFYRMPYDIIYYRVSRRFRKRMLEPIPE